MELLPKEKAKFLVAKGLISSISDARDKSIAIENSIGLETLFSFIAQGMSDEEIQKLIGVKEYEYKFIMMGSPLLRKRYMEAKAFALADVSQKTLISSGLAHSESMSKDQKNATDFHTRNIDRVLKTEDGVEGNTGVIINNTVVVRSKDEIPQIPKELEGIIDADFTVRAEG